jgi:myo-inositol-1(or 4)-monophosphatase
MLNLLNVKNNLIQCLEQVAEFQLKNFRKQDLKIEYKSHSSDLVTNIDKQSEKLIIDHIKNSYSEHSILCEESGKKYQNDHDYEWIIDPLDGTNNYAHGLPFFSISVALAYKKKEVLGVVYVPFFNECYWAVKDSGSFCNDKQIKVNPQKDLKKAVVCTGFPYDINHPNNNIENVKKILGKSQGIRRFGSAAYDLCLVAAGHLNAYWELNLNLWDIAAGRFIVEQAQGNYLCKSENEKISIMAANPTLIKELEKNITW